jgi:hypothetical protein
MSNLLSLGYPISDVEDIKKYAPSVFSEHANAKLSNRYSFVSTNELLNDFDKLGWKPTHVKQNGQKSYARHIVRLTNDNLGFMDLNNDKVRPQIVIDNSHNGGSSAKLYMGLFRLICTNGLVVSMPGMYTSVKLRHVGIKMDELKKLMEIVINQYKVINTHIDEMQRVIITPEQSEQFVIKAMAVREPHLFINADGTINEQKVTSYIKPMEILQPLRSEDSNNDLWSIFNNIQEHFVKGSFERTNMNGRHTTPHPITNATRNIDYNKKLWDIAESYMLEGAKEVEEVNSLILS